MGKEWCAYLRWRGIKRCFRIKENTRIDDLLARDQFKDLQPGEVCTVFEKAWVYGTWMRVVVTLSPVGDRVIVASDLSVLDTLFTYQKRWGVECTFSAMKARGLGLEATHTDSGRSVIHYDSAHAMNRAKKVDWHEQVSHH